MVPHIDSITPDHGQPNDEILIQGSGFRTLQENQKVSFDVTTGPKGKQASNIKPL